MQNEGVNGLRVRHHLSADALIHVIHCLQVSSSQHVHCGRMSQLRFDHYRTICPSQFNHHALVKSSVCCNSIDSGMKFYVIICVLWHKEKISKMSYLAEVMTQILSILQFPSWISNSTCAGKLRLSDSLSNSVTCVYPDICINFWLLLFSVAFSLSRSVFNEKIYCN